MTISRNPDDPQPGFFKLRLVRGGPWVGARITRWKDGTWFAEIDGRCDEGGFRDPTESRDIMRIWHFGRDVTEAEYAALTRQGRDVVPNEKIDLAKKASIF